MLCCESRTSVSDCYDSEVWLRADEIRARVQMVEVMLIAVILAVLQGTFIAKHNYTLTEVYT